MMKREIILHYESVRGLRNWIKDYWEKQLPQVFSLEQNKNLHVLDRVISVDTLGPESAKAQVMATIETIENGISFQSEPFLVVIFALYPYRGNSVKVVAECHQSPLLSTFSHVLAVLESSQTQEITPHHLGGINISNINSAGDVNINLSHVAGRDQITTTTSTTITQQGSPSPAAATPHPPVINKVELSKLIRQHYSLEEFKSLCFELQVAYDDLPGETLTNRVEALVEYLERRGRVPHLLALVKQERPHITWPDTISD